MWWKRRRRQPDVELLSRDGCHLCEEMLVTLRAVAPRTPVTVRDIDAERSEGLVSEVEHARWSTQLPVLLVDGEAVARWRVEAAQLRAVLVDRGVRP